jgi:stringent starvation protein B
VSIPVDRVQGIFARENGQGAFFTVESPAALAAAPSIPVAEADAEPPKPPAAGRTRLKLVK